MQKKQKGIYSNILYLILFDDMTLSNMPDILPDGDAHKRLYFIKNAEGEWKAHILSNEQREAQQQQEAEEKQEKIKERGICIVHAPGHVIGHASERILATLNAHHDLPLQVVVLSEENYLPTEDIPHDKIFILGGKYTPPAERHLPPDDVSLAWLVQHMNENMLLQINSIRDDIQNMFLDTKAKPYHAPVNYTPKTQKSKAKNIRKNNQKMK